jgi:hypothetical protein
MDRRRFGDRGVGRQAEHTPAVRKEETMPRRRATTTPTEGRLALVGRLANSRKPG